MNVSLSTNGLFSAWTVSFGGTVGARDRDGDDSSEAGEKLSAERGPQQGRTLGVSGAAPSRSVCVRVQGHTFRAPRAPSGAVVDVNIRSLIQQQTPGKVFSPFYRSQVKRGLSIVT